LARSKKTQAALDAALSMQVPVDTAGIGVDIVEIDRMNAILERTPTFCKKYFTEGECAYCMSRSNPSQHFAARFAAKEAVSKALGCGFSQGVRPIDVEVVNDGSGKPSVKLYAAARLRASELSVEEVAISLSHTHTQAVAFALAITKGAQKVEEEKIDSKQELRQKFKEARAILDEI
jgi:holo-[acyl-carrier protein] synthase